MVDQGDQGGRSEDPGLAGPGRFRPADGRTDESQTMGAGRNRRRQGADSCDDPAVKGQLSHGGPSAQGVGGNDPHGGHDRQGNGKIIVAAFFWNVRRRQIADDSSTGQGEAKSCEGRADPLPALAYRLVPQSDDDKSKLATCQLDFDIDWSGFDALERHRHDTRRHEHPLD